MSQEEFIKESLEYYSFEVEKIPERTDIKTPDFFATKDGSEYTIELKTKYMNQALIDNMSKVFDQGEMHTNIVSMNSTNRQNKVIHGAKKQLAAEPLYPESFNIAWFHCEGQDASTTMDLFENALYGKECLVDWKDGTDKAYECYYFYENAMFSKYKDTLDGAVISMDGSLKVLLNVYSEKYEKLKNSSLCSTFKDGVQDPIERDKKRESIFVDDSMCREDIYARLQEKYNMKALKAVPMKSFTITSLMPKK